MEKADQPIDIKLGQLLRRVVGRVQFRNIRRIHAFALAILGTELSSFLSNFCVERKRGGMEVTAERNEACGPLCSHSELENFPK
jgi:hypothetical protein